MAESAVLEAPPAPSAASAPVADAPVSTPAPAAAAPTLASPTPSQSITDSRKQALEAFAKFEADRDGTAQPTPAKTPSEPAPAAVAPVVEAKTAVAPKPEATPDPEVAKAYQALRRDRWPKDIIDNLSKERVLELGGLAANEQARQDREWNLLRQTQGQTRPGDAPKPPVADSQAPKPVEPVAPPVPPSANPQSNKPWSKLIDNLKSDLIHSELAEPLAQMFDSVAEQVRQATLAGLQPEFQAMQAQVQAANDLAYMVDDLNFSRAHESLSKEFAILDKPENWTAVKERAYQMAGLKQYRDDHGRIKDFQKLCRDAAFAEFHDEFSKTIKTKKAASASRQLAGQPTPPTGSTKPPNAATSERDRLIQAAKLLEGGMDPEKVRLEIARMSGT